MKWGQIWERYFFREISRLFFLFIFTFYGLYVLIDYSSRTSIFRALHFSLLDLIGYYGYTFLDKLEILLPFALLIAYIRTLLKLNTRNELIALRASGLRLKTLMRPFILFSLGCTLLLYLNQQLLLPGVQLGLNQLHESHFKEKYQEEKKQDIQHLTLKNGSEILYHKYQQENRSYEDVYWVISFDEVYRMKFLFAYEETPYGLEVEHFIRKPTGGLQLFKRWPEKKFSRDHLEGISIENPAVDPSYLSLTSLWSQQDKNLQQEKQNSLQAAFIYKLTMPWLCLLVFLAIAPFCLRFSRMLPQFMIYVCGMIGTVCFYLIVRSGFILADNSVIDPILSIGVPFGLAFGFFGWRYLRLC